MVKLIATERKAFGKQLKQNRAAGQLPVAVYGAKEATKSYFVNTKDFTKLFREAGESTVISLESPDGDKDILIKEVATHPTSGEIIHADLYAIEKGKKLQVAVPLEFEGVAPAVKELSGILIKVLHEVEVEAMPKDLPHDIKVDVSGLDTLESQILVKDLKVPAGVEILTSGEEVVAAMTVAKDEPEEETPIDLDAIEVEKKGKEAKEGEGPETSGDATTESSE
jgi:large subunit ribosomal protein L25